MKQILIIDDDSTICIMLQSLLKRNNFVTETAFSASEALMKIRNKKFDLVLSDFRLPDFNGLELLKRIKNLYSHIPVIIMTSYADIRTAVNAIKMGAFEYVTKPLNPDEILLLIRLALEKKSVLKSKKISEKKEFKFVKGKSQASLEIDKYIKLVAPTDMSVIIEGESGTGKEIAARRIHLESKRQNSPFVAVDCGALSSDLAGSELFGHVKGAFTGAIIDKEGQFESADGGTLFLDEIGNLSYDIQIKLLRTLQERKIRRIGKNKDIDVDVRIIAASNEDLAEAVNKGAFREDLYHRLNEFKIIIPSLRNRSTDIELFAEHFLQQSNVELEKSVKKFSDEVLDRIRTYAWHGNLRELRNVVRRAVLLAQSEEIGIDCMPSEIYKANENSSLFRISDLKTIKETNEKKIIIDTLEKAAHNKSKAARILNVDRKTLYNKMKQYGIKI